MRYTDESLHPNTDTSS